MLATRPCRSVDAAAAQLIAREAGALVAFEDLALDAADLGLDARYRVTAAATEESAGAPCATPLGRVTHLRSRVTNRCSVLQCRTSLVLIRNLKPK